MWLESTFVLAYSYFGNNHLDELRRRGTITFQNRKYVSGAAAQLSSLDETGVTDCLIEEPKFSLHKVGPLYVLQHAVQLAPSPRLLRLDASGCLGRTRGLGSSHRLGFFGLTMQTAQPSAEKKAKQFKAMQKADAAARCSRPLFHLLLLRQPPRLGASGCLGRTGAVPATFSGGAPPLGNLGGGVSPSASGASPLVAIGGGAAPSASGALPLGNLGGGVSFSVSGASPLITIGGGAVPATFFGGAPPLGNIGGGVSPSGSGASPLVAIGGGAAPSASGASQR